MGRGYQGSFWICCQCRFCPHDWSLHLACIECGHKLCSNCPPDDPIEHTVPFLTPPPEKERLSCVEVQNLPPDYDKPQPSSSWKRCRVQNMENDGPELAANNLHPIKKARTLSSPDFISASPTDTNVSEELSTDREMMQEESYERFLHALSDPSSHFARLENLEARMANTLGFSGDRSLASGQIIFDNYTSLEGCVEATTRILDAFSLLEEEEGFCENSFNILVDDSKRNAVATVKVFRYEELVHLHETMKAVSFSDQQPGDHLDESRTLDPNLLQSHSRRIIDQTRWIESQLSPLRVEYPPQGESPTSLRDMDPANAYNYPVASHTQNRLCHAFSTLYSVLRLGLISYSGSHVCEFDRSVFGLNMRNQPIQVSDNIFIRRTSLACLQSFVGGPIWLFGRHDLTGGGAAYRVSIDINTLTDLWGPASGVPLEDRPNEFHEIFTERGILRRVPDSMTNGLLDGEIPCHWEQASGLDINQRACNNSTSEDPSGENILLINIFSTMLIGMNGPHTDYQPTVVPQNSTCGTQAKPPIARTALIHQTGCPLTAATVERRVNWKLRPYSSSRTTYKKDSVQLNGGLSKTVGVGASKTWKRTPGTRHKTVIIHQCNPQHRSRSLIPFLSQMIGLEISICTGNGRRITLWEAIRLANARPALNLDQSVDDTIVRHECTHSIDEASDCVLSCWEDGRNLQKMTVSPAIRRQANGR